MSVPVRVPIWLDEARQRLPTRPCRCGRTIPIYHYRVPMLRFVDAPLFRMTTVVEWCGHQQEGIPVPALDREWVWIVPVLGEAT